MRKISEIYEEYRIMPELQMHMLRVAACAKVICEKFDSQLSEENILSACLLHDMGNILKFKLDKFPDFLKPEGLSYWEGVKKEYGEKYGEDEHAATLQIAKELKVPKEVVELIQAISFVGAPQVATLNNFPNKIVEYCDSRVTPFGVGTLEERLADLRERYAHKGGDTPERRSYEDAVRTIERQIFAHCKIKPEEINDDSVASIIKDLRDYMIKLG